MRGNPLISSENKFPIISIHASAWEATRLRVSDDCKQYNFNSRLCMRGNATVMKQQDKISAFQFTPLHERQRRRFVQFGISWIFQFTPLHERQLRFQAAPRTPPISIHASAWEATQRSFNFLGEELFQFTPLHERQRNIIHTFLPLILFQFTPLHERQLSKDDDDSVYLIFQFTPLHERQQ